MWLLFVYVDVAAIGCGRYLDFTLEVVMDDLYSTAGSLILHFVTVMLLAILAILNLIKKGELLCAEETNKCRFLYENFLSSIILYSICLNV